MKPIYIVLIINLIIWLGIFAYIFVIDKKIKELKKLLEKLTKIQKHEEKHNAN